VNRSVRIVGISLLLGAGVLAGLIALGRSAPAHPGYEVSDVDVSRQLTGRWDWSTRLNPCRDSAQTIAFSPDKKTMMITLEYLAESDSDRVSTYDLVALSRSSLQGTIRGEKRRTNTGAPVVWDLVMFGATEFRWHRTDWNRGSYTDGVIRCDQRA
jgi:hypothetical protein